MMKKIRRHRACRFTAWMLAVTTPALTLVPAQAGTATRRPAHQGTRGLKPGMTDRAPANLKSLPTKALLDVEQLSEDVMRTIRGMGYRNKYLAGTMPWHRSFRDVNLCTGNLFKSFTDIQVAPARGAGLVLQRTYNSNDDRPGPFGIGWTHAYDIRMAERPIPPPDDSTGDEFTDRVDFLGGKHTYRRDADGLYTPPAYLYDELSSEYAAVLSGNTTPPTSDTDVSMDGTTKHFIANGDERVCDTITDRHGNVTTLAYSLHGSYPKKLLDSVTDPSGRSLTFTWTEKATGVWRITTVTGPVYSVTYEYNAQFNLSSVTLDDGGLERTTNYGYATYSDAGGTETGLLSSISDPLQHTVSFTYGLPATNPLGTLWVTAVTEPSSGGTITWQVTVGPSVPFPPNGWVATVSSAGGGVYGPNVSVDTDTNLRCRQMGTSSCPPWTTYSYDYDDYDLTMTRVRRLDPRYIGPTYATSVSVMAYGAVGNVISQSDSTNPSDPRTESDYWDASKYFQKKWVKDPLGRITRFDYFAREDAAKDRGEVKWVRDPGYDIVGSPSYQKQFSYTYGAFGQKASETNLKDVQTSYTYGDQWGNLTQVVQDPGGLARTTLMVYDAAGKVLSSTDPNGQTSVFSYNPLGQPLTATFPASIQNVPGEIVEYTYGDNGRIETVADGRGQTVITYELGNDRVASVQDPVTGTVAYTYAPAGQRLTMTLPGATTPWTYTYDPLWNMVPKDDPNSVTPLLQKITDDQGRAVLYHFDLTGNLRDVTSNITYNGSTPYSWIFTTYALDGDQASTRGRLAQIRTTWNVTGQPAQLLTQNQYTYDEAGMRESNEISIASTPPVSRTEEYAYDLAGRLATVRYDNTQQWPQQSQAYVFDAMGNRTSLAENGGTPEGYTFNNANMLLTKGGSNYTNDANGNTLTGGGRTNVWDSQNRLRTCTRNGATSTYTYGDDGMRRRTVFGTDTTDTILDNSMMVRENLNGNVHATYLAGPRGPEYRRQGDTVRWYAYDGLGSVLAEVDVNGVMTASRTHDVYGLARSSNGTATSKHKFVGSLGHTSEDDTGLVYMRARWVDPAVGRFVSEDPAKDGGNWFGYCRGNPVNMVDANGKNALFWACLSLFGAAVIGIGEIGDALDLWSPGMARMVDAAGLAVTLVGLLKGIGAILSTSYVSPVAGFIACGIMVFAALVALGAAVVAIVRFVEALGYLDQPGGSQDNWQMPWPENRVVA